MALAVKHTPEVTPSQPQNRMPVVSLLGVGYVLACLFVLLKVLPDWGLRAVGLAADSFAALLLVALVVLAVATVAVLLGLRLLGDHPPAGSRAGIAAGVAGVLLALL